MVRSRVRKENIGEIYLHFCPVWVSSKSFAPSYGLAEGTLYVSGYKREQTYTSLWLDVDRLEIDQAVAVAEDSENARAVVACGLVVPEQRTVIVNHRDGQLCKEEMVGEIWVSGSSVAQGYWASEEATQVCFQGELLNFPGERFLRTGDLGFIKDNELYVIGRIKDVLIVNGRNLYPQDIEFSVQNCHPAVRKEYVAAFQRQGADGSEQIVVVAELNREYRSRSKDEEDVGKRSKTATERSISSRSEDLMGAM